MSKKTKDPDRWLINAEVRSRVTEVKGRWEVDLIFIDTSDPSHILVRSIADYHSERIALIYAEQMKLAAARDERGTQKVEENAYGINKN